jgi:hypothetical protein
MNIPIGCFSPAGHGPEGFPPLKRYCWRIHHRLQATGISPRPLGGEGRVRGFLANHQPTSLHPHSRPLPPAGEGVLSQALRDLLSKTDLHQPLLIKRIRQQYLSKGGAGRRVEFASSIFTKGGNEIYSSPDLKLAPMPADRRGI